MNWQTVYAKVRRPHTHGLIPLQPGHPSPFLKCIYTGPGEEELACMHAMGIYEEKTISH